MNNEIESSTRITKKFLYASVFCVLIGIILFSIAWRGETAIDSSPAGLWTRLTTSLERISFAMVGYTPPANLSNRWDGTSLLRRTTLASEALGGYFGYGESGSSLWVETPATIYHDGAEAPSFEELLDGTGYTNSLQTFVNDADDIIHFQIRLPRGYKESTPVTPYLYWAPMSTPGAGLTNIVWELSGTWRNPQDSMNVLDNSGIVFQELLTNNFPSALFQTATPFTTLTNTNAIISSVLVCKLRRLSSSASDNYDNHIGFLSVKMRHQIDSLGSRTISAK